MTIELSELSDAATKAFPADALSADRDESWQLIAEMGWLMLELPEDQDGLGLGPDAVATIHYELGKTLPRVPLLPALLGLKAVAASTCLADQSDWIERLCTGEYVPVNLLPGALTAGADGKLSGSVPGVFEADMASHVLTQTPSGYLLIALDAAGVTVTERPLWDPSRRIFDIELADFAPDPALIVAEGDDAERMHDLLSASTQLALAADSLGAANTILDMTVDYLKMRKQFDRPLAMFQALKHRVADLKVKLVAAEALLWSAANDATSLTDLGGLKAHAIGVFNDVAEEAIQLHGGIGLTEEHPCHLFFKRAKLNASLGGDIDHWQGVVGRAILDASSR